jgi:hypothetical protein
LLEPDIYVSLQHPLAQLGRELGHRLLGIQEIGKDGDLGIVLDQAGERGNRVLGERLQS